MNQASVESSITSPQNSHVKELVELRKDGETRRARGCFLLEGQRAVGMALAGPATEVLELLYCDKLASDLSLVESARAKGVALTAVSKDVFKKIADVVTPQGLAAVVRMPAWSMEQVLAAPKALLVVACGLQDPGNLGTLIRSCEAAGAAGLLTLEGTADPYNAKVVRSTAACLLHLPILRVKRAEFLALAAAKNIRLVGSSSRGGKHYGAIDWESRPLAICIGNEGEGLPPEVEAACHERVTIPMRGHAESLNAAVAASILLFQAQAVQ